jgi:hypothetical protein
MNKTLLFTLSLAASTVSVRATNIVISDFAGNAPNTVHNVVTLANGNLLTNGATMVRFGYFNTSAQGATWLSDLQSTDVAKINSALQSFIPLGENAATPNLGTITVTPTNSSPRISARTINGVSENGRIVGQVTAITPVAGAANTANAGGVPAGSRIFVLVYSDADAVLNNGEQFGVFSADIWSMPSDGGLNLPINTTDVNTAGEVYRGLLGSSQIRLSAVGVIPEPTTGALGLLAGLGMLARRRRK